MTPRLQNRCSFIPRFAMLVLGLATFASTANAAPPDHWVGTWGASPVAGPNPAGKIISGDTTLREIVHISLGGSMVRVVLSNEFGLDPLTIGSASIALRAEESGIIPATAGNLTFGGHASIVISARSAGDQRPCPAPARTQHLPMSQISFYLPEQLRRQLSIHNAAYQTS